MRYFDFQNVGGYVFDDAVGKISELMGENSGYVLVYLRFYLRFYGTFFPYPRRVTAS